MSAVSLASSMCLSVSETEMEVARELLGPEFRLVELVKRCSNMDLWVGRDTDLLPGIQASYCGTPPRQEALGLLWPNTEVRRH